MKHIKKILAAGICLAASLYLTPAMAAYEIDPDYTMKYNDPGKIEQRYRWHGPYEVKSVVLSDGEAKYGNYKYKVWYPVQQAGRERPRPLVITLNGTGGSCDKDDPSSGISPLGLRRSRKYGCADSDGLLCRMDTRSGPCGQSGFQKPSLSSDR